MKSTVVTQAEMSVADTWSPSDYLGGAHSCHLCGLAPVTIKEGRRPDPASVLLEAAPRIAWRPQSDTDLTYRCRNREACARRQRMKESRHGRSGRDDRPAAEAAAD